MALVHFDLSEFDCKTLPGSGERMDPDFLNQLDRARELSGVPWSINSGFRTKAHNDTLKNASPNSSHIKGLAVDISARSSAARFAIVKAALQVGITRIGIGKGFVHLDVDPDKPQGVIWHYYPK